MAQGGYYDEDGRWVDEEDPYRYADYTQPGPGAGSTTHDGDTGLNNWTWDNGDPWAPTPSGHETADAYFLPGPPVAPSPSPTSTSPPPGAPPPTGGGGGGGPRPPGPPTGGFRPPVYGAYPGLPGIPNAPTIPNAPAPNLPTWTTPAAYQAPTQEEAYNDQGYQFGLQQGNNALQQWAAARGTLNDTGTAKALLDYGRNAATQQYVGVDARARDTYKTNYQTQYVDPYQSAYKSALDVWAPQLETWKSGVDAQANQWKAGVDMSRLGYTTDTERIFRQNQSAYDQAWQQYQDEYARWKNGPLDDQAWGYATAG